MAERSDVYISWTLANWVTVVLMAALGMALIGIVTSAVKAVGPAPKEA